MATKQVYYDNMGIVNIAREEERLRNIKRAQAMQLRKQKEEVYMQQVSQNVNISRQNILQSQPRTEVQQKHALKSQRKRYAQTVKASKKTSKRKKALAKIYAKDIKRYENTPWMLMYTASGANVLGGLLTELFGIGYIFTVPATLFIDVMVWKAFSKKNRVEIRAELVVLTVIKFIPIVGMVPASVRLVYVAKKKAKKNMERSKMKIKKISAL